MRLTHLVLALSLISLSFLLLGAAVLAQPSPGPIKTPENNSATKEESSMLEYVKFLREEEKSHREYMETLYTRTVFFAGGLGAFAVLSIGFLQLKTKQDVKKEVDTRFKTMVKRELQDKMEQVGQQMEAEMQKITEAMNRRADAAKQLLIPYNAWDSASSRAKRNRSGGSAELHPIQSLTKQGLIGKTLGKKGGERWFVTQEGRKYLLQSGARPTGPNEPA